MNPWGVFSGDSAPSPDPTTPHYSQDRVSALRQLRQVQVCPDYWCDLCPPKSDGVAAKPLEPGGAVLPSPTLAGTLSMPALHIQVHAGQRTARRRKPEGVTVHFGT